LTLAEAYVKKVDGAAIGPRNGGFTNPFGLIAPTAQHNSPGQLKGETNMKALTKVRTTYAAFCLVLLCAVAIPARAATITNTNDSSAGSLRQALADNAGDTITPTLTPTPSFPLKISTNGHYLTLQDGTPFLMVGDTAWTVPQQATDAEIDEYIANRAAKGFNTILVEAVDGYYSSNAPRDILGTAPFTTPGNFSTYNPTYFNRFDHVIDKANEYGIVCIIWPLYLGYYHGLHLDGWADQMLADTSAHLQAFATFLGNRYKNKGNIIWSMGGDSSPFSWGLQTKTTDFANALLAADPNHLVTEHNARNSEGIDPWIAGGVPSWFTLNTVYTDLQTFSLSQTAWNRTPTRPFFLIEAYYENNSHVTGNRVLRSEAYWSILSGCAGYMFGNCPLFGLSSPNTLTYCTSANSDWRFQMDNTGSQDMTQFKNLFTSVAWEKMVPDFNHTVVTAGYGSGVTTVTTARASDGSFVLSYLPAVSGVTVDMTTLTGSSVAARWYDPTNGTYTTVSGSPFPNTGIHVFTPTGNNSSGASDWVLLLQSTPTPTAQLSATHCSILQKRLDRLQLRQQRLQRLHRSNKKLSRRIRRLGRQLQLQACL
jgi:hypothetical protein